MAGDPRSVLRALHLEVSASDAEAWSDALLDAGAMSIDAVDAEAGTAREAPLYDESAGAPRQWWPRSELCALFEAGNDPAIALAIAAGALHASVPAHRVAAVADQDWVASTRAQFVPFEAAPGLWIVPTWCEPVATTGLQIRLDPGIAFGTGSHPTTAMCLAWLTRNIRAGGAVLDYGCGSGILAIAAAKLGATQVEGVDVDPQAIRASRDNARQNEVRARFSLATAGHAKPARRFGVVVANILANPLRLLAPLLASRCRSGGQLALSGILEPQAGEVISAYAKWFSIEREEHRDGWVLLAGVRNRRGS